LVSRAVIQLLILLHTLGQRFILANHAFPAHHHDVCGPQLVI